MSLIVKPFTLTIKNPELTKRKMKSYVRAILNYIKDQYRREVAAWIRVFCPKDSGDLASDLEQSTMYGFITDSELELGIVLYLDSRMPYSELVELMTPPVNWKNPTSEYQFFSTLVAELTNQSIPRMIKTAIDRKRVA